MHTLVVLQFIRKLKLRCGTAFYMFHIIAACEKLRMGFAQKRLYKAIQNHSEVILNCRPLLHRGSPEHYYHFLFDVCLPLHAIVESGPQNTQYILNKRKLCFEKHVQDLFHGQVTYTYTGKDCNDGAYTGTLWGMNPRWYSIPKEILVNFKQFCGNQLHIDFNNLPQQNRILLIRRKPTPEYHRKKIRKDGTHLPSGSCRRSIINHDELLLKLREAVHPDVDVQDIQLETMSLKEQIIAFHSAKIVIGQHGAGLSNIIFQQNNGIVVEIGNNGPHFKKLSTQATLQYYHYSKEGLHLHIDTEAFTDWVNEYKSLRALLK